MIFELLMAGGAGSVVTGAACYSYVKFKSRNSKKVALNNTKDEENLRQITDDVEHEEKLAYYPLTHLVEQMENDDYPFYRELSKAIEEFDAKKFLKFFENFRRNQFDIARINNFMNLSEINKRKNLSINPLNNANSFFNNIYSVHYDEFQYFVQIREKHIVDLYEFSDMIEKILEINDKITAVKKMQNEYIESGIDDVETGIEIQKKINNGERKIREIALQFNNLVSEKVEQQKIDNVCGIYNEVMMIDL